MSTLRVNLKKIVDNSYDIIIGKGLFDDFISWLKENPIAYSYVIITDSNVRNLYGESLRILIDEVAEKTLLIDFPAGEKQKTREIKIEIENKRNNKEASAAAVKEPPEAIQKQEESVPPKGLGRSRTSEPGSRSRPSTVK